MSNRISSSPRTICSRSPAATIACAPTAGCPRRSNASRVRRSRPTSKRAGRERKASSWLSEAKLHYSKTKSGERRLKAVKVRLCDWLFRAILLDRHVLDYAAAYFQLGPIERRIYEVARSTCNEGGLISTLPPSACRSAIRTRCRTSMRRSNRSSRPTVSPTSISNWSRRRKPRRRRPPYRAADGESRKAG